MAAELTLASDAVVAPGRGWTAGLLAGSLAGFVLAFWLAPENDAEPGRALTALLLFGYTAHVASTGWFLSRRALRSRLKADPRRLIALPLTLIATGIASACVLSTPALSWALLAYFGWQFLHFQQQNLGMVALVARAEGLAPPSRDERRALQLAGLGGVAALLLHPELLQLDVSHHAGALFPAAAAVTALGLALGLRALATRPQRSARHSTATLLGLLFFLPVLVFDNPYVAVAGLVIAHSWQYLWLMGHVAAGSPGRGGSSLTGAGVLLSIASAGGLALAQIADRPESPTILGSAAFGLYLGVVMAHFAMDRVLWRTNRKQVPRREMRTAA